LVIGFDQKEAVAYHVFCQSAIEKSTIPLQIIPLSMNSIYSAKNFSRDGSNAFIYSRFLTPYLMDFNGWAIFADGDMICKDDLAKLWGLRDSSKAVQVVKHDYKTKFSKKYLGNKNENYPRKNWSSLILWNCEHPKNKILNPEFIQKQLGSFLHRFSWLQDHEIGELDVEWNWLAIEYDENPNAKIIHYTLGTPCFKDYKTTSMSSEWYKTYKSTIEGLEI
jgi:lipopolysaccharide biosynthesis glycosyltransferase